MENDLKIILREKKLNTKLLLHVDYSNAKIIHM